MLPQPLIECNPLLSRIKFYTYLVVQVYLEQYYKREVLMPTGISLKPTPNVNTIKADF